MNEIRFFVPGRPAPGGSKRAFGIKKDGVYTGRFVVTEAGGEKTKNWRASVGLMAAEYVGISGNSFIPLTGAVEIELRFQMPRPKSHYKQSSLSLLKLGAPRYHTILPDVGKLARSTVDAMTGIIYRDDAQIIKETHEKVYSDSPGCLIVIREVE